MQRVGGRFGVRLVDRLGGVVGIDSASAGSEHSLAIALPANVARSVLEDLQLHGSAPHASAGLELSDERSVSAQRELRIVSVAPNGSAANAELTPGDHIVAVDGKAAPSASAFARRVFGASAGTDVTLRVLRNGKQTEQATF